MARKKKSAPVHSGLGPSFLVRILPGKNHPRVFCSQGNGGFPALRLFRGAPKPRGVGHGLVDDQRVSRQHPVGRSRLGPPGCPRGSDEQRELSAPSCRGRFALRQPFPSPFGNTPIPEGFEMPASFACQLEAFRSIPANRFRHHPLSEERASLTRTRPCCRSNSGRNRWWGCLFRSGSGQVPLGAGPHPFSGCLLVRGRHRVAFATPVRRPFDHVLSGCPSSPTTFGFPILRRVPSAETSGCRC